MVQSPGFENADKSSVCRLNKVLYGLKQAPQAWYERLTSTLLTFGFKISRCDPSIFIYSKDKVSIYVLVYVDDIILTGSSAILISELIRKLNATFALKELGNLDYFLGVELKHLHNGSLLLTQAKYIRDLLAMAHMTEAKGIASPMISNCKLRKYGTDTVAVPDLCSVVGAL